MAQAVPGSKASGKLANRLACPDEGRIWWCERWLLSLPKSELRSYLGAEPST